jgi:hypothetical protein
MLPIELMERRCGPRPSFARFAEDHALERLHDYIWDQQHVQHDLSGFRCYPSPELRQ